MASTNVSICNLALSLLARKPIQNLDENSKEAMRCTVVYEGAVERALRAHPWAFAKVSRVLADEGDPPPGYAYRYQYPTNCVFARRVRDAALSDRAIGFEVVAGPADTNGEINTLSIATDEELAVLEYTARVTNPAAFPHDFAAYVSLIIAETICLPLTGDLKLKAQITAELNLARLYAQSTNESERYIVPDHTPDWIAARA